MNGVFHNTVNALVTLSHAMLLSHLMHSTITLKTLCKVVYFPRNTTYKMCSPYLDHEVMK